MLTLAIFTTHLIFDCNLVLLFKNSMRTHLPLDLVDRDGNSCLYILLKRDN